MPKNFYFKKKSVQKRRQLLVEAYSVFAFVLMVGSFGFLTLTTINNNNNINQSAFAQSDPQTPTAGIETLPIANGDSNSTITQDNSNNVTVPVDGVNRDTPNSQSQDTLNNGLNPQAPEAPVTTSESITTDGQTVPTQTPVIPQSGANTSVTTNPTAPTQTPRSGGPSLVILGIFVFAGLIYYYYQKSITSKSRFSISEKKLIPKK